MARECSLSEREARRYFDRIAPLAADTADAAPRLATREAIHDLRVACRRGRVFLVEFGDNLPAGLRREARKLMRKIGRRLGEARELDASLALLRDRTAPGADDSHAWEFAVLRLEVERLSAQTDVIAAEEMLVSGQLAEVIARLRAGFEPSSACHLRHARARLRKRLGNVQERYHTWRDSGLDEDLHRLRIRLKTLRYAVELYRSLYGKRADRFLEALAAAQDSLGRWNDLRCLKTRIARAAKDAPHDLGPAVARLAEAIGEEAEARRGRLDAELGVFFERRSMKKHRALFDEPSRACCRGAR